jgi:hypothetical protein
MSQAAFDGTANYLSTKGNVLRDLERDHRIVIKIVLLEMSKQSWA